MATFELIPENFDLIGYQYVPLIYAWDVKFDGRRRACLVANEKSQLDHQKKMFGLGMTILAADISSAYLMSDTKELMYTRLGPEFGDWAGQLAIIRKA
eukprot:11567836-Ditylum_brightwellii.AAC.1